MMTAPAVFDFRGHEVRVVESSGEPHWVASDVAKVLGYRSAPDMVRNVEPEEADTHNLRIRSANGVEQSREVTIISEAGLYEAILKARVPAARDFKRWVTREVLPTIRKHGAYMTPATIEEVLTDPDTIIKLATDLKRERERRLELEAPAKSWHTLAAAGGDFSVSEAAKTLSRDPAIRIGRDQLFRYMRDLGWIFRTKGHRAHWEAYQQKAIAAGRLVHKMSRPFLNERTGEMEQPAPTVRITPKGLQELHELLGGSYELAA